MKFSQGLYSGAVLVRRRFGGWAYLLLRSTRGWQFVGGARGDDESLAGAARRQACEAAAISGLRFYWGHHYFKLMAGDGQVVRFLIAENADSEIALSDAWLEYRWVSASVAAGMLPITLLPLLHWADAVLKGGDGTPGVKR